MKRILVAATIAVTALAPAMVATPVLAQDLESQVSATEQLAGYPSVETTDNAEPDEEPFAAWGLPTPPGAEDYEVSQVADEELDPQGIAGWEPTSDPQDDIVEGQMRSDSETVPEGFSDMDADRAEVAEAALEPGDGFSIQASPRCSVYWPSWFEVCGSIRAKYDSMGGPQSFLSLPKSYQLINPDGVGRRSEFINGFIYWHPDTGAHSVSIPVSTVWQRHGWEGGFLGYPTTSDMALGGQWFKQSFQGGHVYTHNALPASQASIQGAIYDKWQSIGAQDSELGYPISDELIASDGIGRYNVFEGGMIYWTPQHGAHPVGGTILLDWALMNYESGELGYPIDDPIPTVDPLWDTQDFERGTLKGASSITQDHYWPIDNALTTQRAILQNSQRDRPAENYESRVLPCVNYLLEGNKGLALIKVRDKSAPVLLTCERFRNHMATNPEVNEEPGHFQHYPPTRADWYNFLGCAFYTFNAEEFTRAHPGNWGRQRYNTYSETGSVMIARKSDNQFITGWAGENANSSEWEKCTRNLKLVWR